MEKASYKSNKSATLTSLGRLLEAVFEAREAIRLEPFYQRAHNRLATSTTGNKLTNPRLYKTLLIDRLIFYISLL
ncbi:putative tetratricopeptide-like helical domain superfamily, TPR repeat-containing thioredoxin TTL1-4 [Helianthus annuus]|nr:putative tetratricopeptide-like helical domain superfamily, TPR repeat-containing thioredoxin TTL1-4 [Helianthus annuus]KAJ0596154.1 putative tetratricopeptide-like helical domain superfamily, TPR repeat-containing thioredoxin TTL1-4 [Helianthus annuus]KAJ0756805.1 putative tetratricopeptide-like helical domain superfamily, TPR repeat-containing thioredoxin TTL1-4 [Helianthus annuus]